MEEEDARARRLGDQNEKVKAVGKPFSGLTARCQDAATMTKMITNNSECWSCGMPSSEGRSNVDG